MTVVRASIVCAVAVGLAGCAGASTWTAGGVTAPPQRSTSAAVRPPSAFHRDLRPSWISPQAKKKKQLLFVSDAGTGDVYMYAVPSLELVGTITGFSQPQGECSDSKGDVWITDTNAQTIYEVSHEGRFENKLSDPNAYPDGCAWNPKNGDIAVMNLFGLSGAPGSVLVYPHGTGVPTTYTNPKQYYYNFGGYDSSGNLYFDGRGEQGNFMLSKLAAGAKSAASLMVSGGKIYFPGMVQWQLSSGELLVGDQECGNASAACVYRLTLSGSSAHITGATKLANSSGGHVCDLVQGVVETNEILGSDYEFCGYSPSTTDVWPYPTGGKPSAQNATTDSVPVGAALSPARSSERSWMRAETPGTDLVYVSDADGEVTVYNFQTMSLVGVLTNFENPTGECVDTNGNVYIADAAREVIYEYAHGGTKAIKTLSDSPYVPNGCSVNPMTGDLAVANSPGTASSGTIAVYAHASGKPTLYTDPAISSFVACAYDNVGNLLTTGEQGTSDNASFAWLSSRTPRLVNVKVPGPNSSWKWYYVSGIQWDGKFFALDRNGIYRIALINGQAYYVGETTFASGDLSSQQYGMYDPNSNEQATQVLIGYNTELDYSSGVLYFAYPDGGSSTGSFTHGVDDPYGVVISLANP